MKKDYYLLFIWRCVEPKLLGPYKTSQIRDEKAKELREDHRTLSEYYPVEVDRGTKVKIYSYSNTFFEEE